MIEHDSYKEALEAIIRELETVPTPLAILYRIDKIARAALVTPAPVEPSTQYQVEEWNRQYIRCIRCGRDLRCDSTQCIDEYLETGSCNICMPEDDDD